MFRSHRDLPLSSDPAIRILPWIVGLTVYLATMTLAGALLVSGLATQWSAGLTGTLTIHISATEDQTLEAQEIQVKNAVRLALKTPGVATARAMSPDIFPCRRLIFPVPVSNARNRKKGADFG